IFMEGILGISARVNTVEEPGYVRLVFRKQKHRPRPFSEGLGRQSKPAQGHMIGPDGSVLGAPHEGLGPVTFLSTAPGPGVAEPQRGQQVKYRRLWSAVDRGDLNQHVIRTGLGVLDEDIEIMALVENPGVLQLELRIVLAAAAVLFGQPGIRERRLRILVQGFHVGMRRRGVEIEVALLAIFAMIALWAGQTKQPFLEDRVASVPQRHGKTEPAFPVANPQEAVLSPAVGTTASVVMRKITRR